MNKKTLLPIFFLALVAVFLGLIKFKSASSPKNLQPSVILSSNIQTDIQKSKSSVLGASDSAELSKGGVILGAKDSKVTVVEFSDPSCPYCAIAAGVNIPESFLQRYPGWQAPGPQLEKLAKEGKIQLVFRYFPGHGTAEKAMMAAWCAEDQKKEIFWSFLNNLFKSQSLLGDENIWLKIAQNLGLNSQEVKNCVDSGKYKERIVSDTEAFRQAALQLEGGENFGTPTFFINGRPVIGAQSFTELEKIINSEL